MAIKTDAPEKQLQESFQVFDCAPVFIATGVRAFTLRELIESLRVVHLWSIQHHFWGRLLRPAVEEPEYSNDFAAWTGRELRDKVLAERLSVIYPSDYTDIEELRGEIIDVIENRLDEDLTSHTATAPQPFHFLRSQLVVFDTGIRIREPSELPDAIKRMSEGSIFYHFIEARRRTVKGRDDFSAWLELNPGDYHQLCAGLTAIDPYFSSLGEIRERLENLLRQGCPQA
ncbi:MAG: DUF5752 family protein [bacterium]|nr:DUF5752 family protein [bacterium]MDT8396759.1 DUF5752 family protein [bacterium]